MIGALLVGLGAVKILTPVIKSTLDVVKTGMQVSAEKAKANAAEAKIKDEAEQRKKRDDLIKKGLPGKKVN